MPRSRKPGRAKRPTQDSEEQWIYGVHPVMEALVTTPESVDKIIVARESGNALGRLLKAARKAEIPVSRVPRITLDRSLGLKSHQGVAARAAAMAYEPVERIVDAVMTQEHGLMVVMDRVEDVGNFGAALRTCVAAGVQGVITPAEGSAGLTPAVERASAGTARKMKVGRVAKLRGAWEEWKKAGLKTAVLAADGSDSWSSMDWRGSWVLAVGRERDGVRPWMKEEADSVISLPMLSEVESLNVSVALGVVLYERIRKLHDLNESSGLAGS